MFSEQHSSPQISVRFICCSAKRLAVKEDGDALYSASEELQEDPKLKKIAERDRHNGSFKGRTSPTRWLVNGGLGLMGSSECGSSSFFDTFRWSGFALVTFFFGTITVRVLTLGVVSLRAIATTLCLVPMINSKAANLVSLPVCRVYDFCLIFVPFGHYDEPEILSYAIPLICSIGADGEQNNKKIISKKIL